MHPTSNNNPAAAGVSSMLPGGDRPLYGNSVDHRQIWFPQPQYGFAASSSQQQQSYLSPTHGSYYNNHNNYLSYSTPPEHSEPPSSPPRITQNEGQSPNLSMMSSVEETSSDVTDQSTNIKKIVSTKTSSFNAGSIKAERRQEVVDGRAQNDVMSRVASPTREHLPPKKRMAMSKESALLIEIDKLKKDLGKAQLKIKVLEEENERLRQHRNTRYDRSSNTDSSMPFIPDLSGNAASLGKDAVDYHQYQPHHHHIMKQQLQSIYRVPSFKPDNELLAPSSTSSHQNLQIPHDVFIQNHHKDVVRPLPYDPYPHTATKNNDKYDRQQQHASAIYSESRDWKMPPSNKQPDSSTSPETPTKRITFALSFDANAISGSSSKEPRGYNRCVSNRGRGSRPPLASRYKSR
ncbi:hypothetical protein ACHAXM_008205 [Skeletonema potamos]|jgi:hypothetical protein